MILLILQLTISLLLATAILLQARGLGLSSTAWGVAGGASWRTKRGAEKWLFSATIVLGISFLALSLWGSLL